MAKGILFILAMSLCISSFICGAIYIENKNQLDVTPPVNGSVPQTTTIEVKINENFLSGDSLVKGWSYSYQYFYSGYRIDPFDVKVAVFTAVSISNMGGATPMQFYVHVGEQFTLYEKVYTLKYIDKGSVLLEVSG